MITIPRRHRRIVPGVLVAVALLLAPVALAADARHELASRDGSTAGTRAPRHPARVAPGPGHIAEDAALEAFSSCAEVREYIIDAMVETLVDSRYGRGRFWETPWSSPGGDGSTSEPADYTTTNNQEQGVDELDFVKTDGGSIYVTAEEELLIVDSWPPEQARLISRLDIGEQTRGLLVHQDLAAVLSRFSEDTDAVPGGRWNGTRIDLVDLTDRTAPEVIRSFEVEGVPVGARLIDGQVYAVLSAGMPIPSWAWDLLWRNDIGLPELPWDASDDDCAQAAAEARVILRPLVAAILVDIGIDHLMPWMRRTARDGSVELGPLLGCADLYHPSELSDAGILIVAHLPMTPTAELTATGLIADGWTVYASSRSLYVAREGSWWWLWGAGSMEMTTTIHRFDLGNPAQPVRYAATGVVEGWLVDQLSMSEHHGFLRVATCLPGWWWGTDTQPTDIGSRITVLADDGAGVLQEVGKVSGIAPGERITTARFLGDVGYLVTFEQVDPLFTVDLSDPMAPRVVGELELPGFSSYLHPMDSDHLLAVGRGGDDTGLVFGVAVSIFDVGDLASPLLDHQLLLGADQYTRWAWTEALWDHHAFTYHRDVLSMPLYKLVDGESRFGLVVLGVDADDGITELGQILHDDLPAQSWPGTTWTAPARMRRSLYVEDNVYSLSNRGIKVNRLEHPDQLLATVPFYPDSSTGQ